MKQIRFLLTALLLWVGGVSAAWADGPATYYDEDSGITYDLFLYNVPNHDAFYARIKRIETDAEELTIPDWIIYDGTGYQVAGFDEHFESGDCPNLTTLRFESHLEYLSYENYIGYVYGSFLGMPLLSDIYFNDQLWPLRYDRTTFPGVINLHARDINATWASTNINYYLIPEYTENGIGYYFQKKSGTERVASVVSIDTSRENVVIPATVQYNSGNFKVFYFKPTTTTDLYLSKHSKDYIKTLEFEGEDVWIDNADLRELSRLEKITFDGNVRFEPNVFCWLGGSKLNEVVFKGNIVNWRYAFKSCEALKKVCIYGDVPTFDSYEYPEFYDVSNVTFYVNLTAEEIRTLKSNSPLFWRDVDVRPFNATPEGGVIVGSVSAWLSQLAPEQTLDLTTLRPIGRQDADDWATIKSLCNGTLASAQILDLREMSLAEGLQLDLSGFTSLTTVYLPANAVTMANNCFSGCNSSLQVIISSATPPTASENAFGTNGSDVQGMTLDVPSGTLNTYRTLEPWKHFGTIIATTATGDASLTLFAGISNGVVELWKGSTKVGSISKKGGLLTETVQMPADLQLRVPSQYLDKVKINGIDVTSVLPSVASTEAPYEGYKFFTVDDLTPVTFIEVAFEDNIPQRYETSSLGFLLRGDGTVEGKITTPDGVRNIELTDGVLRYEQWGTNDDPVMKEIESLVLTVKPQGSSNIQFNCGNSTYTSVDNNDGSYTYTILGENMHSSFFTIDLMEAGGDVKTIITSRDNIELGYYFGLYSQIDEEILSHTVQEKSSLKNASATVMHYDSEDYEGMDAEVQVGIVYIKVPQGTQFQLVEDGTVYTSDNCEWHYAGDEAEYGEEAYADFYVNSWRYTFSADGYYYRLKNIKNDSYVTVANVGEDIVSPYQIPLTLSCYGDGVISLRNGQGEEVKTVSDGEQKTVSVEKGNTMTLVVTAPEGVNLANYEALLFIDGVVRVLEKTDAANGTTTFEPFTLENIVAPCNIVLSMKQTGGFNNPDIIAFADPNVEAICVENWDTDHDGKLSKTEAAAVTTLIVNETSVFSGNTTITSFDELKHFTGLTSIPEEGFVDCSALKSIVIPESVTSMGQSAFAYCYALTDMTLSKNVTTIPSYCFYACYNLETLVVPEGVQIIDGYAFSSSGLKNVVLPQSLQELANWAFDSCKSLKYLVIPKNMNSIGKWVTSGSNIDNLFVESGNEIYYSPDGCGCIIIKNANILLYGSNNAHIPSTVMKIEDGAFEGLTSLKEVELPANLQSIGVKAFKGASKLQTVTAKMKTPFAFSGNAFDNIHSNCKLIVPRGTKDAYIAKGWTTDVFGGGIVEAPLNTDVNGDGQVSISDAVIIVDEILNK